MLDFNIAVDIYNLEDYMDIMDYETVEEVVQEYGSAHKNYVSATGTSEELHYQHRVLVPVMRGNYGEAVRKATEMLLEEYDVLLEERRDTCK